MNLESLLALFGVMLFLAAVPGVSTLTVVARSVSSGFLHGAATTLGIVCGDVLFILVAIIGLSFLSASLGELFLLVKILGGIILLYLGIKLWRRESGTVEAAENNGISLYSSYMAGLLITLGDQKAVLFYLGFFPAFLDLSTLSIIETVIVVLAAVLAITVAKLGYAYLAVRTGLRIAEKSRTLDRVAAILMLLLGLSLLTGIT